MCLDGGNLRKGGVGGGALEDFGPVTFVAELPRQLAAVGVGGDHDGAGGFGQAGKLVQAVHAVDEALETKDDDVSVLRVDFDSGDDEEVVTLGERGHFGVIPEEVVLG